MRPDNLIRSWSRSWTRALFFVLMTATLSVALSGCFLVRNQLERVFGCHGTVVAFPEGEAIIDGRWTGTATATTGDAVPLVITFDLEVAFVDERAYDVTGEAELDGILLALDGAVGASCDQRYVVSGADVSIAMQPLPPARFQADLVDEAGSEAGSVAFFLSLASPNTLTGGLWLPGSPPTYDMHGYAFGLELERTERSEVALR